MVLEARKSKIMVPATAWLLVKGGEAEGQVDACLTAQTGGDDSSQGKKCKILPKK
jgi:hypothetical protein